MGYPQCLYSDRHFVVQGLLYVCGALAFMGVVVTFAVLLGARVTEYQTISFGVAGIAMLFVAVGIYLLASFQLREWRSLQKSSDPCHARRSRDLWDDQLDG